MDDKPIEPPPFVDNDSVRAFAPPDSIPVKLDNALSIMIDHGDNKWLWVSTGILVFDGRKWSFFNQSNSPFGNISITYQPKLTLGPDGSVLALTTQSMGNSMLLEYKNGSWNSYQLPFRCNDIMIDQGNDQLYFVQFDRFTSAVEKYNGIGQYEDASSYIERNLPSPGDYCSYRWLMVFNDVIYGGYYHEPDFGILGTINSGIAFLQPDSNYQLYKYDNASINFGFSHLSTSDGINIFMNGNADPARVDSLYQLTNGQFSVLPFANSVSDPVIEQLAYQRDKNLWFSFGGNQLAEYKNHQFRFHNYGPSISHIFDFEMSADSTVWAVDGSRLLRFKVY